MVRSSALSGTCVALPPTFGRAQIFAVLEGQLIWNETAPHICSKSGRYGASESLYTMQAVSELPISRGSTGGNCDCSASVLLSKYPVARESQKFPPKKACS